MSGFGVAASYLGLPDAGLATYTDFEDRVRRISSATTAPLIADADTGFGGLLNVRHTVRGYEAAGAAAIQIEDQVFPKKCGHTEGRRVVKMEEMVDKIRVAVESRKDEDFLIVARTDARTTLGLDEALKRGEAYAKAGADIIFVESPESEAELEKIGRSLKGVHLLANMVEGGRTPMLSQERLAELGFAVAIYPSTGLLAAARALDRAYEHLLRTGSSMGGATELFEFGEMTKVLGLDEARKFEARYGGGNGSG